MRGRPVRGPVYALATLHCHALDNRDTARRLEWMCGAEAGRVQERLEFRQSAFAPTPPRVQRIGVLIGDEANEIEEAFALLSRSAGGDLVSAGEAHP